MHIPENIKKAIRKAGKYNAMAAKNNAIAKAWVEKQILDEEKYLDIWVDAIEIKTDGSEELIKFLENDCNGFD